MASKNTNTKRTYGEALEVLDRSFNVDGAYYETAMDAAEAEYYAREAAAERWAEDAWLRHAENAGWQETALEEQIENERGVIQFADAFKMALTGRAWA